MKTIVQSVIVEDIEANRNALKKLLTEECPYIQVIGEAETLEEAENIIKNMKPRLVFMDIEIKKATSFDLLEKLHEQDAIDFEIIFFTAHGTYEYATRAIEYSALDFLTKPIDSKKLGIAVEKASKKIDQLQYNAQIALLLETLKFPNAKNKRIAFHLTKGVIEFVEVDTILYLEADSIITYIHLQNGNKLTAMKNLGHYSKLLMSDYNFFPISNSLLVNTNYVKRYNHSELTVHLTNGKHIFASRRGGQDFKRYLNNNKAQFKHIDNGSLSSILRRFLGK